MKNSASLEEIADVHNLIRDAFEQEHSEQVAEWIRDSYPTSDCGSLNGRFQQRVSHRRTLDSVALLIRIAYFSSLAVALSARAEQNSGDTFFVVASKNQPGLTSLGTPSVNNIGDIVVTTIAGTREHRVFLNSAQLNSSNVPGSIPFISVRPPTTSTLSSFPTINDTKSVVSYVAASGGVQIISRYDLVNGSTPSYTETRIARSDPSQSMFPFSFLSPIAAIDNATPANVYFYGERQPLSGPYNSRIYASSTEVTTPAVSPTPIASSPDKFSSLDPYVAASQNANVVYRGTGAQGLGIYRATTNVAVATTASNFPTTGSRSSINTLNTAAFYGSYTGVSPALNRVFLQFAAETVPRLAGNLQMATTPSNPLVTSGVTPSSVDASSRIALNDYNQVAYLGTDSFGHQALFATTLGATRKIIAVGDSFQFNNQLLGVSSLALFNGIGKAGQVFFSATMSNGDQLVIRGNRMFTQATLNDSPIQPSYETTQYLLRSVPGSGFTATKTIGAGGCNLTSTVNVLDFFGSHVSPAEFQQWLINSWRNTNRGKSRYITPKSGTDAGNDFPEAVIEQFSRYLIAIGRGTRKVMYNDVHRTSAGPNLTTLVTELRAGRPVKMLVPSGDPPLSANYKKYHHYILAYGLVDPSKPDPLTPGDILIADPGHGQVQTLQDYGNRGYDSFAPGWWEDDKRLYLYQENQGSSLQMLNISITGGTGTSNSNSAFATRTTTSSTNPVEAVLTDPRGRRTGLDPATGELNEIPEAQYLSEPPYYSLDDDPPVESMSGSDADTKRFWITHAIPGQYQLELIGVGSGSYDINIYGASGRSADTEVLTGMIAEGQRTVVTFNLSDSQLRIQSAARQLDNSFNITAIGEPQNTMTLQTSPDLINWTDATSGQSDTGTVEFAYRDPANPPKGFFRVTQSQ